MKVSFDRSSFLQLDEYREVVVDLAEVEGEIDILAHENDDYKRRVDQVIEKIEQKKSEISQLELDYKRFQSERNVSKKYYAVFLMYLMTTFAVRTSFPF